MVSKYLLGFYFFWSSKSQLQYHAFRHLIDSVGGSLAVDGMPAKDDNSDKEKNLELFLSIGLDERTAKNTVANSKVTANLIAVIHEVRIFPVLALFGCREKKKKNSFSISFFFFFSFN